MTRLDVASPEGPASCPYPFTLGSCTGYVATMGRPRRRRAAAAAVLTALTVAACAPSAADEARAACKTFTPPADQVSPDQADTPLNPSDFDRELAQLRTATGHAAKAAKEDQSYAPLSAAYLEVTDDLVYFESALNAYGWERRSWTPQNWADLRQHASGFLPAMSTIRERCTVVLAD